MNRNIYYTRLYEPEIQKFIDEFHAFHAEPTEEEYVQARQRLWSYHLDRFIDTLKGYHEVVTESHFPLNMH